ncbi:MAG: RusA family crossover junction endodeoxyribonuclease [Verrucomicrobiota bacterium]
MKTLEFFVPGLPCPGGSKRFVGFGKKTGRAVLIDDAGERNKNWRTSVAQVGSQAMTGLPLFSGPLNASMEMVMPRPKGHLNSKGLVKTSAPIAPTTKPDVLKLARSTEDALTGVVWVDDAQTVELTLKKRFAAPGEGTGARIKITPLS